MVARSVPVVQLPVEGCEVRVVTDAVLVGGRSLGPGAVLGPPSGGVLTDSWVWDVASVMSMVADGQPEDPSEDAQEDDDVHSSEPAVSDDEGMDGPEDSPLDPVTPDEPVDEEVHDGSWQ